ncbi:MAG: hypothetical protein RL215_2156, partial [Planctomycetota bacterium]
MYQNLIKIQQSGGGERPGGECFR